jgi:hypothetical protein
MESFEQIKRIMQLDRVMKQQTAALVDAVAAGHETLVSHFTDSQNTMATVIGNITDEPAAVVIERYNAAHQEIKGMN